MTRPRVAVFYGEGFNTDMEMEYAFQLAGSETERVHARDLIYDGLDLKQYQILVLPGGFLHGDDIASGRVFAAQINYRIKDEIREFSDKGNLILGVCNGFQALVKSGILPDMDFQQKATLTYNDSGHFEDRWIYLRAEDSPCVFTKGIDGLYLPVRHGEGKFYATDDVLNKLEEHGQLALRYVGKDGRENPPYPENPNGSLHAIAGVCDSTGRVFGLMPHPEAFVHRYQHPRWTREHLPEDGNGLQIFRNAVNYSM